MSTRSQYPRGSWPYRSRHEHSCSKHPLTILVFDKFNGQFNQTKSMERDNDLGCVVSVLESLMDNTIPLIVRVGHVRPRIVCSSQSAPWTVMVNEEPRINVLPRRWLNSTGEKVRETWRAALRAVIGTVVFRPGISQVSGCPVARIKADTRGGYAGRDRMAVTIGVRRGRGN